MNDKTLRRYYLRYNRKYFDNTLPHDLPVAFGQIQGNPFGCVGTWHHSGEKGIAISYDIKNWDSLVLATLLHEMVHWKLPGRCRHCKHFDAEMLRLAQAGAFNGLW